MLYILFCVFILIISFVCFILIIANKLQKEYEKVDLSENEIKQEKIREIKNIKVEISKLNKHINSKKEIKQTLSFPKITILDESD